MTTHGTLILIFMALTALARGSAGATVLYSPPVYSADGDRLSCVVQNLGGHAVDVDAVLVDQNTVVDSGHFAIAAGESLSVASSSAAVVHGYCVLDFDDAADDVRGFARLTDAGGSDTRLLLEATPPGGALALDTTTVTPPVRSTEGDILSCLVQNLSAAPLTVKATLVSGRGNTLKTGSLVVASGEARVLASTNEVTTGYCRFTFDGDPASVRGYVRLFDFGGSNTRLLYAAAPAAPADGPLLYSPPIANLLGNDVHCLVQNLSDATVQVSALAVDGSQAMPLASGTADVLPGYVEQITATTATSAALSCQFSVRPGTRGLRAFIGLASADGGAEHIPGNTRLSFAAQAPGGAAGQAATTVTAPLRSVDGNLLGCVVQNRGAAPVAVDAALEDGFGGVVAADRVDVGPGDSAVPTAVSSTVLLAAVCRFTFDGSPDDVRGFIALRPALRDTRLLAAARLVGRLTPLPTATPTPTWTAIPSATSSSTPTATATATFSATVEPSPTATQAPASPTPTATAPGATATATAQTTSAPATACAGDCDGNGAVAINELLMLVDMALDGAGAGACPAGDANADGALSIAEVVIAVANALGGCPAA